MDLFGSQSEGVVNNLPATDTNILSKAVGPAHFAAAAYCPSRKGNNMNWNCATHCTAPQTQGSVVHSNFQDDSSGMAGSITYQVSRNVLTVAFRGTQADASVITDIRFALTPIRGFTGIPNPNDASVHDGFLTGYLSVQKDILNGIQQVMQQYPKFSIEFVGHSLGAATSQLAALDAYTALNYKNKITQYSFNGPRVGNQGYTSLLKFPIYRFTHGADIVSRMPPPLLGFQHPNAPEYWEDNGQFKTCKEQESSSCNNSKSFGLLDPALHLHFYTVNFDAQGC